MNRNSTVDVLIQPEVGLPVNHLSSGDHMVIGDGSMQEHFVILGATYPKTYHIYDRLLLIW